MESEEAMVRHLVEQGYTPISIEEESKSVAETLRPMASLFKGKVSDRDISFFSRQFVTLVKAGIPLVSTLQTLQEQTQNKALHRVLSFVIADVEKGESLGEALAKHPQVFSELYIAMIRTGEASGQLESVLSRLAEMGEYEANVKAQVKTATFYPKLILGVMFLAFLFITTFILPRFTAIFEQAGVDLFVTTKFLLWLNFVLRRYWYLAIAFVVLSIFGIRFFLKTPFGRDLWDRTQLKLPVFGTLFSQFVLSRFARTLSVTTKHNLPILEALDIVSRSVGNTLVSKEVLRIRESVSRGEGISRPMKEGKVFPPLVVKMVSVGEETGKLDELLMRVSEHFDFEVDNAIKKLTVLIEPVLLVILGGMVLFLILSIFVPLLSFYTKIAKG